MLILCFSTISLLCVSAAEVVLPLPNGGGFVGLSTRGTSALRVRLLQKATDQPFDTPMIGDILDAPFTPQADGIVSAVGVLKLSSDGRLSLMNSDGATITTSQPIHLPSQTALSFETVGKHTLFGRGGGDSAGTCSHSAVNDGAFLSTNFTVSPRVMNCATYAPYYYSTAGYGALGAVNATALQEGKPTGGTNTLPLNYTPATDGHTVSWAWGGAAVARGLELYLMPAPTLDAGTRAYYSLIGAPLVPPRWAFGFIACRWGWSNQSYIEDTLARWRAGRYPADAFIMGMRLLSHHPLGMPPTWTLKLHPLRL